MRSSKIPDLPQLSPLISPQTAPQYHDPSMTEWHKSALTCNGSDTFLELQEFSGKQTLKQIFVLNVFPAGSFLQGFKCVNVLVLEFFLGVAVTYGGNVSIIPPQMTKSGIRTGEEGWNFICLGFCPSALEAPQNRPFSVWERSNFPSRSGSRSSSSANNSPSSLWSTPLPMFPDPARR